MTEETPENYQGSSALSPASISEKPFWQNERAQLLEIEKRNLIHGPKGGKGKYPSGVGSCKPGMTDAGRFPSLTTGSHPWAPRAQARKPKAERGARSKPQPLTNSQPLGTGGRGGCNVTVCRLPQQLCQLGQVTSKSVYLITSNLGVSVVAMFECVNACNVLRTGPGML